MTSILIVGKKCLEIMKSTKSMVSSRAPSRVDLYCGLKLSFKSLYALFRHCGDIHKRQNIQAFEGEANEEVAPVRHCDDPQRAKLQLFSD